MTTKGAAYVLDTSAIVSYLADEAGADTVADILEEASEGKVEVSVSFMTLVELEYYCLRKGGRGLADDVLRKIRYLPWEISYENQPPLANQVATIKAENALSLADAWVTALALSKSATLVHKDPEFEAITAKPLTLALPYK